MAKVSTEDVEIQLKELQAPQPLVDDLLARLNQIIEEEKAEREGNPKVKYEHVIVGIGPRFDPEAPMFLVKIEEGEDHSAIPAAIKSAAKRYNEEQAGKKPRYRKPAIETVGEAFLSVSGPKAKEEGFAIVAKEPVIGVSIEKNELDLPQEGAQSDG